MINIIPPEILYHILYFADGYTREQCKVINQLLYKISLSIHIVTLEPLGDKEVNQISFNQKSLNELCSYGYLNIIRHFDGKGNWCWVTPFINSCRSGDLDTVKYMSSFIAKDDKDCWDSGALTSVVYGHINIFQYIYNRYPFSSDLLLNISCRRGYSEVLKLLLDVKFIYIDYKRYKSIANEYGHSKIYKILEMYEDRINNVNINEHKE